MGKRKRPQINGDHSRDPPKSTRVKMLDSTSKIPPASKPNAAGRYIQIVTGSYDRALHGIIGSLGPQHERSDSLASSKVTFHDNFLFKAHGSAIRCLATSPPPAAGDKGAVSKVLLATGGTDERVNLYQLDACIPSDDLISLGLLTKSFENPKNKEIGALLHHSSSINALHFASKSKLLSAAGDNTIAVTRTRDWAVLSSIKAPVPQPMGRPSGDTAGPGETPAGINDFAVHPSHKLMISTGRGERCMRLWNLVTGKKAGVLNFEKDLLQAVGEGRWAKGEGLKVEWNAVGDEFAVAFERGVAVFAMDSKAKGIIRPVPPTKIHQIKYMPAGTQFSNRIAVSTEDGRVLIYSTQPGEPQSDSTSQAFPSLPVLGQIGGEVEGVLGRIKDFVVLSTYNLRDDWVVITASSDGTIRLWALGPTDGLENEESSQNPSAENEKLAENGAASVKSLKSPMSSPRRIGELLGEYQTSSRITCLTAFTMLVATHDSENQYSEGRDASEEFEGFD